jgi:putative ABC transport system permease protein
MNSQKRSGLIRENLEIAVDVICMHKLRSGLIILGVAIGVASLMSMVSILLGMRDAISGSINSSEQTVLSVQKYDIALGGINESMLRRKKITVEDAEAIRERCPSLHYVAFIIDPQGLPMTLRYKNEKCRMVQISGTQPALFYIRSFDLEDGRMFTDADVSRAAKVVVIGHSIRRDLFQNIDPIGKTIRIGNDDYTVIGTFAKSKSLTGGSSEIAAFIPYTTYKSGIWEMLDDQRVETTIRDGISPERAREEVIQAMRKQRKLKANQDNDFAVSTADAALDLSLRILTPVALILTAISSIALLVGGIGVMNIMLVSVTERTSEIGIRKAVGALRSDILWQFLIEAGALTGFGGIVGIVVGLSGSFAASRLIELPFKISLFYVLLAIVFSVVIGMFFGLYPAYRASKQSPIKAIGYAK